MWNITVRLVGADGGECVGETMRSSQMETPKSYSLSVTPPNDSRVDVTLRSASGDYACTFPARTQSDGFTSFGVPGFLSCEIPGGFVRGFVCKDGRLRDLISIGENISGHISGNQITGEWRVSWVVVEPGVHVPLEIAELEATYRYEGSR